MSDNSNRGRGQVKRAVQSSDRDQLQRRPRQSVVKIIVHQQAKPKPPAPRIVAKPHGGKAEAPKAKK